MADVLHMRVKEPQLARWHEAAELAGSNLASFVRLAVEEKIAGRAAVVSREDMKRLLEEVQATLPPPPDPNAPSTRMVTVRVSDEERAAWGSAASAREMTLTSFLKMCVRETVERSPSQVVAEMVVEGLRGDLERMFERSLGETAPAGGREAAGPKPFDRDCFDADLHQHAVVCGTCGGSFTV